MTEQDRQCRLPPLGLNWAFFLDVDGTLLELASRPDAVILKPRLVGVLDGLREKTAGAVALISGRSLADLDNLFSPLKLPLAGQHGLERRDAGGVLHHHKLPDGKFRRFKEYLMQFAGEHPGVLVEDKNFCIAVHYRQTPDKALLIESIINRRMAELRDDFHLQKGKMVFEIKPGGKDKGTAIQEFMEEAPFRGRTPVFIGDDATDEDGFRTVNLLEGHSIKVGPGNTAARWWLADSDSVLDWLISYLSYMEKAGQ